jgi:hypothetical protein
MQLLEAHQILFLKVNNVAVESIRFLSGKIVEG